MISVLFIFSCKVNSDKGREKMDQATDNVVSQINGLNSNEVTDAIKGFADLSSLHFDLKKSTTAEKFKLVTNLGVDIKKALINNFPGIFNHKSDHFSISEYAGTYTWNYSKDDWDFSSSPSDEIIIIFPSDKSTTNDCKFEWSKYSENSDYIPTKIYAVLYKNNKLISKIDYTGEYDSDDFPTLIQGELKLSSIKLKVDYKMKNNIANISTVLKNNGRTIDDFSGKFNVDKNNKCDWLFYKGSGTVKMYKVDNHINTGVLLKVKFDYDYTDINWDWDASDFNDHTKIKIYTSSDRLIGHVEINSSDCGATIVFNDGTTQDVCKYFDRIDDAIENDFDD